MGDREAYGRSIKVKDREDFTWLDPRPSQKLRNHSPDGFEWGYCGSGPAQLSLAILLDHFGNPGDALQLYQHFKEQIISTFGDEWEITGEEIDGWLARIQTQRSCKLCHGKGWIEVVGEEGGPEISPCPRCQKPKLKERESAP